MSASLSHTVPRPANSVPRLALLWDPTQASDRERALAAALRIFSDTTASDEADLKVVFPSSPVLPDGPVIEVVEGRAPRLNDNAHIAVWALGAPNLVAPTGATAIPDVQDVFPLTDNAIEAVLLCTDEWPAEEEERDRLADLAMRLADGPRPVLVEQPLHAGLCAHRPRLRGRLERTEKASASAVSALLCVGTSPALLSRSAAFQAGHRPAVHFDPDKHLADHGAVTRAGDVEKAVEMLGAAVSPTPPPAPSDPTDAIASALRQLWGSVSPVPAHVLAANLDLAHEIVSETFMPETRLVTYRVRLTGTIAVDDIGGAYRADTDETLYNESVRAGSDGDGVLLSAFVVLPPDLGPGGLTLDVLYRGVPVLTLTPGADMPLEPAGGIAFEPAGDGQIAFDFWARTETTVQMGRRMVTPLGSIPTSVGLDYCRAVGSWPFDRDTLSLISGERISKVRSFWGWTRPGRPSSDRLISLKDRFRGKVGWLIGNGPSVQLPDLDRLAGRDDIVTFTYNRFHLAHGNTALRSDFTVSGDRQIIEDFGSEILRNVGGEVVFADRHPLPVTGDYIWLRQIEGFPSLFSKDAPRVVSPGGSSMYLAMQLGYYLGIRDFYLYGADFKFVYQPNQAATDSFRSASGDGNHFIPNYRSGKAWCPPSVENIITSFLAARLVMEHEGGSIKNATHGGALEVFDRVDFDAIIPGH